MTTQPRTGIRWVILLLALIGVTAWLLTIAPEATAQGGDVPAMDEETGQIPRIGVLFATSAVINSIILVLSVVSCGLFVFFILTINIASMAPNQLVNEVRKLVSDSKHDEAAQLCRRHQQVFVATVLQRCVENADKEPSVLMNMIDSEGRRRADLLWNRISYLADISNVAPMLGLLGTVWGLIKAFFGMKFSSLSAESSVLTSGIGGAMTTTLFGLIVAILALAFYSIIKTRATKALAEAEQVSHAVADHITHTRGGGSG